MRLHADETALTRAKARPATASERVEGPWTLPDGWEWKPLGDLGSWCGGGTPSKVRAEYWVNGTIPWVSPKDMKRFVINSTEDQITSAAVAGSSAKLIPIGSILCVMRSGILRHTFPVAVNSVAVTLNQDMRALTPDRQVNPDYLAYYLRFSGRTVLETSSKDGTTVSSIEAERLDRHPVPLPDTDTQKRIVAEVDELFAEVDDGESALERARGDLTTWRKALLKAAVTGELTADWRAANPPAETGADLLARILAERRTRWLAEPRNAGKPYKEPVGLEEANLPDLPAGWSWASLDQLASEEERSFQSGPFGSALLHSEFQDSGKLVIGIDNVRDGWFSTGSDHRISDEKFEALKRFKARPRDLLLTVMATVGRTCIIPEDIEDAIITKHVYRITLSQAVAPDFVMNAVRAGPCTVSHLFGNTQGQTRPGLNKDILQRTPIPLAPLKEQLEALARIASSVAPGENLMSDLTGREVAALRQSILAAAFRGDLVQ